MKKLVLLFPLILFIGCHSLEVVSSEKKASSEVMIKEIKENSSLYLNKVVEITGEYKGWRGEEGPPVTRSDWVIDDKSGAIYVTGKPAGHLSPIKDIGRRIKVKGKVLMKGKQVYLEAMDVKILHEK